MPVGLDDNGEVLYVINEVHREVKEVDRYQNGISCNLQVHKLCRV